MPNAPCLQILPELSKQQGPTACGEIVAFGRAFCTVIRNQLDRKMPYRHTKCIEAMTTRFHAMKNVLLNQTG